MAAVLFASGGEAAPGPVGVTGSTRFDWDGERVVRVEGGAQVGVLSWDANEESRLSPEVLEFARIWADGRGLGVAVGEEDARLVLRAPTGSSHAVALGRDGWRFVGTATALSSGVGEAWLQDEANAYVRSSAGLIECGLALTEQLGGDVAAFAVSWGELFDRAVLPARGVVPLRERVSAGAELIRRGTPVVEAAGSGPHSSGVLPAAWLASGAFLLALLATALTKRS